MMRPLDAVSKAFKLEKVGALAGRLDAQSSGLVMCALSYEADFDE